MSDLIKREDAIKAINLRARIPHDVASAMYASMAINAIYSVQSADRPHGEWVLNDQIGTFKMWDCSRCGIHMETRWNYCPNCGAKMDGERKEKCNG